MFDPVSQTVPPFGRPPHAVPPVVRVSRDLFVPAARRLVSSLNPDIETAARRLVESAPQHNIDLTLCFVTLEPGASKTPVVRQACLAVRGEGRTAMIFISDPAPAGEEPQAALEERAACIEAACAHLRERHSASVRLAQTLPEPEEHWSERAARRAGFFSVGTLAYLRRDPGGVRTRLPHTPEWPEGIRVERVSDIGGTGAPEARERADKLVMHALEASYADTLDCPELCGLREMPDVLRSHRSTGEFSPALWWVISNRDAPLGAMLFNACPDQKSFELVYLGLAPALRGKGLGRRLLTMGLEHLRTQRSSWPVTCAVDERNTPALRLYTAHGFSRYSRRLALVRPI